MQKEIREESIGHDIARLSRASKLIQRVLENIDPRDEPLTDKWITSGQNKYGIPTKLNSMRHDLKGICFILGKLIE